MCNRSRWSSSGRALSDYGPKGKGKGKGKGNGNCNGRGQSERKKRNTMTLLLYRQRKLILKDHVEKWRSQRIKMLDSEVIGIRHGRTVVALHKLSSARNCHSAIILARNKTKQNTPPYLQLVCC